MKSLYKYKEQASLCNLFYYDLVEFIKTHNEVSKVTLSYDFYRTVMALPFSLGLINTLNTTIVGLPYETTDQKEPYIFYK